MKINKNIVPFNLKFKIFRKCVILVLFLTYQSQLLQKVTFDLFDF